MGASCKKSLCMTSYGGIIRIRLKGRSWMTSSQPANTSSPVSVWVHYSANLRDLQAQIETSRRDGKTPLTPAHQGCLPPVLSGVFNCRYGDLLWCLMDAFPLRVQRGFPLPRSYRQIAVVIPVTGSVFLRAPAGKTVAITGITVFHQSGIVVSAAVHSLGVLGDIGGAVAVEGDRASSRFITPECVKSIFHPFGVSIFRFPAAVYIPMP